MTNSRHQTTRPDLHAPPCELCQGSAICPQCVGRGYHVDDDHNLADGLCGICAGERFCPDCNGTGEAMS